MPRFSESRPYNSARAKQLLERALRRSGKPLTRFAREDLVRDVGTVRDYLESGDMPAVVLEKLEQLAKRRGPRRAERARTLPVAMADHARRPALR